MQGNSPTTCKNWKIVLQLVPIYILIECFAKMFFSWRAVSDFVIFGRSSQIPHSPCPPLPLPNTIKFSIWEKPCTIYTYGMHCKHMKLYMVNPITSSDLTSELSFGKVKSMTMKKRDWLSMDLFLLLNFLVTIATY